LVWSFFACLRARLLSLCFRPVFDGTIKHDIPIKEMSKLWGCNYFIVSQVNPVSGGK